MTRRTLGLNLAVAGLALICGLTARGQDKPAHHAAHEKCAKACNDCQRLCDQCGQHCLQLVASGQKEHVKTVQTCQDCADFCAAAAQIVARGGPFADLICQSCAEACARCAKACAQHADDKMMKACADECKRCEKECRDMLTHIGKGAADK